MSSNNNNNNNNNNNIPSIDTQSNDLEVQDANEQLDLLQQADQDSQRVQQKLSEATQLQMQSQKQLNISELALRQLNLQSSGALNLLNQLQKNLGSSSQKEVANLRTNQIKILADKIKNSIVNSNEITTIAQKQRALEEGALKNRLEMRDAYNQITNGARSAIFRASQDQQIIQQRDAMNQQQHYKTDVSQVRQQQQQQQ